jgi:hypothetical protein
MPIPLSTLRRASISESATLAKSVRVRKSGQKAAFLCHSHLDAPYVEGLLGMLRDAGWDVYVDWKDASMPPRPNRETAEKIQARIRASDYFLFLATPNSTASRWCPWEIGYADGRRPISSIFVITTSSDGANYGNEYLQLYRTIDLAKDGGLAYWLPGQSTDGRRFTNL